ncbi:unnamed protein product, partial [Brassica oleracea var. botrytis]
KNLISVKQSKQSPPMATTSSPPCYISVRFLHHLPPSTAVPFLSFSPTQRKKGGE